MHNLTTSLRFSKAQFFNWRHLVIIFGMVTTGAVNPMFGTQVSEWVAAVCLGAFVAFGIAYIMFAMPALRKETSQYLNGYAPTDYPRFVTTDDIKRHNILVRTINALGYRSGGYVYIIRDIDVTGFYKIGKSNNLQKRFTEFVKFPFQFTIVHIVTCRDMSTLEALLHRRFSVKRVRGEWFALDAADVAWIKQIQEA